MALRTVSGPWRERSSCTSQGTPCSLCTWWKRVFCTKPKWYMTHEEVSEMMDNTAQQLVARAEQLCKDSNAAEAKCQVAKGNDCREKLIRLCEKNEIDVLVLGSRGSGAVASLLLGSTADHCLNNAHCSVFLVK
ncbi:hypothetical protein QOT17_004035 [Balamuthia mandrillaris]